MRGQANNGDGTNANDRSSSVLPMTAVVQRRKQQTPEATAAVGWRESSNEGRSAATANQGLRKQQ